LCKGLHLQEVQRLRLQVFQSKFCNILKYFKKMYVYVYSNKHFILSLLAD
jgi:hypothetical protein